MLFNIHLSQWPDKSFQQFADKVSDARRAGDINKAFESIAETMKLFGNHDSAYGKTVANKDFCFSTSYGNEDIISKKSIVHISKIENNCMAKSMR